MKKTELDFVIQQNHYLKDGTKEACVKARDFLKHATNSENQIQSTLTCVSSDEFVKAVKTLMAFAFQQEDTVPKTWHCDNDCHRTSNLLCPGECNIDQKNGTLCPYFMDESYI